MRYYPEVFNVKTIEEAKAIILTPEAGQTTEERWAEETPFLVDLICEKLNLKPWMTVLDYGCGIGRMSKALIERVGCGVIGVDISADMRRLAEEYVADRRFATASPDEMAKGSAKVDAAISIWVLQHCIHPSVDIARLRAVIRHGGMLFVLNMQGRAIPMTRSEDTVLGPRFGWGTDNLDVEALLRNRFRVLEERVEGNCFWMIAH